MTRPRLTVHPLFTAMAALEILSGAAKWFCVSVIALILHETGHIVAAKLRHRHIGDITLMPYGAVINNCLDESAEALHDPVVAGGGPIASGAAAIVGYLLYKWTGIGILQLFAMANTALFVINMMPAYPLDGSRIILHVCKNKISAIKMLTRISYIMAALMAVLFALTCLVRPNYSLVIMGVFLILGARKATDRELIVKVRQAIVRRMSQ